MQTRFRSLEIPEKKEPEFSNLVGDILSKFRSDIIQNDLVVEDLFLHGQVLTREHSRLRRKPEDVTKEQIIEPFLKFLGYSKISPSTGSSLDNKEADYTLEIGDTKILVEAEPLNKDLYKDKKEGVGQVKSYLNNRSFKSDLGIATNGTIWVLIQYDNKVDKFKEIQKVDLSTYFSTEGDRKNTSELHEKFSAFYTFFSEKCLLIASDDRSRVLEQLKEKITSKFYEDYIRYVFGYDKKTQLSTKSLLGSLRTSHPATDSEKRLFVVTLVNRLIFIKFLEDKGLVRSPFLRHLQNIYNDNNIPLSFYRSYLQPLFYEVFNTPQASRNQRVSSVSEFIDIPYLNSGLFREVVENEDNYDIDNDIIGVIINTLETYRFTLEDNDDALNPDILGLVFEKTINYVTGLGNNRQKDVGAYYTPDDVTTYISRETIHERIFDIIKLYLQEAGWLDSDIRQYSNLDEFLENLPNNTKTLSGIYEKIRNISILDPACGSGHFLTSALKHLLRIHTTLLSAIGKEVNSFDIKKNIISNNLFGVDIENSAVEIARLRLWLSLIEDLSSDVQSQFETLPNIEYNVDEGNSLIGFTSALPEVQTLMFEENKSSNEIYEDIDNLKKTYRFGSNKEQNAEIKSKIESKMGYWKKLLNKKFALFLDSDHDIRLSVRQIEQMEPFHWRLMFSEIFARHGGFDIIIGNPPYIEKNRLNYPTEFLKNYTCGNTYAYFFEISLNMLSDGGYIGFIVPVSSICTPRMSPLQNMLIEKCELLRISSFDDRPSKIFHGLEHSRSSIIVGRKNPHTTKKVFTTKYNRWYAEERAKLFTNLLFVDSTQVISPGIIPKIGTELELNLLGKIRKFPPASKNLIKGSKTGGLKVYEIFYHNAPQYWIRAMTFVPEFQGKDKTKSSHVKSLYVSDLKTRDQIICLLNSSLFYWFFVATSNGRDLTAETIETFNVDLDKINEKHSKKLQEYCGELMTDLIKNSEKKTTNYKTTGAVIYQEFFPKYSKHIIDKIDDLLGEIYDFSPTEVKFIKSFDERFRMGSDESD